MARRYFEGCRAVAIAVGQHRGIANKGFALPEKAIWIREKLDGVRGVWLRAAERAAGRGENRRWRSRNGSTKVGETNTITISENGIAANSITVEAIKKNSGAEVKRISVAKGNNVAGAVLCPADHVVFRANADALTAVV